MNRTPSANIELFSERLRKLLAQKSRPCRTVRIKKHADVYTYGDRCKNIYFIESGQIKLLTLSPGGKECLLAMYIAGDIFGELCFARRGTRRETARTMTETVLKQIPSSKFLTYLKEGSMTEGFVTYLTARIAEQNEVITGLVTVDSEKRLGKTLLYLARKLGKEASLGLLIDQKITQEELSEMVGTTRPRISFLLSRFRERGLIEQNHRHYMVVREKKLSRYLNRPSPKKRKSSHNSHNSLREQDG